MSVQSGSRPTCGENSFNKLFASKSLGTTVDLVTKQIRQTQIFVVPELGEALLPRVEVEVIHCLRLTTHQMQHSELSTLRSEHEH